jgi:2-keto-4-pentenoate hydratase
VSKATKTAARLAETISETTTARGAVYGTPENNFGNIAAFWSIYLTERTGQQINLSPADVAYMNGLQKMARLARTPEHEDSALDAATYVLLGLGCA